MNKIKQYVISLLCVGMFLSVATAKVAAVDSFADSTEETIKVPETLVGEVNEKRESNIKTFLTSEFRYQAYIYPNAVHYIADGKYENIDNRLVDSKDDLSLLENTANTFKIKFAKNTNATKLVSFSAGSLGFSWGFEGLNQSFVSFDNNEANKTNKITDISQTQSIVLYSDVFFNTDLQYILIGDELKENFILKDKGAPTSFTQNISIQQGSVVEEEGTLVFKDKDGITQYVMSNLTMSDAAGEYSDQVRYTVVQTQHGINLTIIADPVWINDPARVYPITIDPSIQTSLDRALIDDAHVSSGLPSQQNGNAFIMKTGYGSSSQINYSFMKFTLPALTSSDLIVSAALEMRTLTGVDNDTVQVNVHEVTSSWSESTITWNNKPSYNSIIEDYAIVPENAWVSWDITKLTKKWVTTGTNNGLVIRNNSDTSYYTEYYSADTGTPFTTSRPNIIITYVNNNGLESYWNYHTQSVGRAGTGYVNDYNGNLVFIHGDTSTSGNLPSVSVSHIFNSGDVLNNSLYSPGWRINYAQTISEVSFVISGVTTYYCKWTDEDGTIHYFTQEGTTNIYKDENGSGLVITDNGASGYDLSDTSDNVSHFDSTGKLITIKNGYNQTITLAYNANGSINTITDAANRVTTFTYTSGKLTSITDPFSKVTSFVYTNTTINTVVYPLLTQITDFEGKIITYTYDGSGYLNSASNFDGHKIEYTFATNKPYRVTKIQEKNGTTLGNDLDISYSNNQTTYVDSYNASLIEQFDDTGKTTNLQDGLGNAQYFEHGTGVNINNMTNSSKLQTTIVNLLTNASAELTGSWTYVEAAAGDSGAFSTTYNYYGAKSFQIIKTGATGTTRYHQSLALIKGKPYTFSAYAYANNANSKLKIEYRDVYNTVQTIYSSSFPSETSQNWTRQEVFFTLPSNAYSTSVTFSILIENGTGTTYFDALQVEEGTVANRVNLVENSDFRNGMTSWTGNGFGTGDGVTTTTDTRASNLDNNVLKVIGSASVNKYPGQTIYVDGAIGDSLVFGAWAKGNSASTIIDTNRRMAIELRFNNTDGTTSYYKKRFNEDSFDWQYLSYVLIAPKAFNSVTIYLEYRYNINSVMFDGISLFKESFGTSYVYDSVTGNVTSVKDIEGKTTSFNYDAEDNLTKVTNPDNSDYDFTYDAHHNLESAISNLGVTYGFGYDSYGNPINSSVISGGLTIKSTTGYTSNGLYTATKTDALGNTVVYGTATDGTLNSVTDPLGNVTSYTYDSVSKKLTKVSTILEGTEVANTYTYENDRLKTITHNGFAYTFIYDTFGNVTSVKVGTVTLSSNTYDPYGRLDRTDYGNGHYLTYSYDAAQRVTGVSVGGTERFTYEYDASGNLARVNNKQNSTSVRYVYDLSDRLVQVIQSNGNITSFTYDLANNASVINEVINSTTFKTTYTYDSDQKLTNVKDSLNFNTAYGYDTFGRLTSKIFKDVALAAKYTTSYTYTGYSSGGVNYTSAQLASITNGSTTISYLYDDNGNITSITSGGLVIQYYYDALGQVIRENNQRDNKTFVWDYDFGGNILTKKTYGYTTGSVDGLTPTDTDTYLYNNSNWKDQLTSFNGLSITYDAIGNPTAYNGRTFTWDKGRQLSSISATGLSASYTYNDSGIRISKIVGGVTTNYHLNGNKVSYEKTGSVYSYYTYDSNGQLVSINYNGAEYYYVRNGQNDIIGLVNSAGVVVVNYTYSTYGEIVSITGSLASTLGVANPYRYRGYRYDTETGLFYVGSRYYDPQIGRFINADTTDILDGGNNNPLENNLFVYCFNNPVNMTDEGGYWPEWITKAIAVVAVVAAVVAATAITISTFGAGSVAGVAMISASLTIAARATEVNMLQVNKGRSERKSSSQIAKDCIESVYDNGKKIVGITPFTKVGIVGGRYLLDLEFAKMFGAKAAISTTLKSVGGKVIPYVVTAYAWGQTFYSAFSENPVQRAAQRGYTLK